MSSFSLVRTFATTNHDACFFQRIMEPLSTECTGWVACGSALRVVIICPASLAPRLILLEKIVGGADERSLRKVPLIPSTGDGTGIWRFGKVLPNLKVRKRLSLPRINADNMNIY